MEDIILLPPHIMVNKDYHTHAPEKSSKQLREILLLSDLFLWPVRFCTTKSIGSIRVDINFILYYTKWQHIHIIYNKVKYELSEI